MVLPPSQWRNEVPLEVPNANQHHFAQGVRVEGKSGGLEIVEPAAKLLSTTLSDDDRTLRERSGKNILDKIIDRFPNALAPASEFRKFPEPVEHRIRQARMRRGPDAPPHPVLECGAFPEIGCVWAAVDSSFFLWQIDSPVPVPLEYAGEGQVITTAGLVRPTPGVFVAAVEYVVILCTVVDVVMLALSRADTGSADPELQRWELRPIPHYTAPTDAVILRSMGGTAGGRVFLGADDGRVYELQYKAAGTWGRGRCQLDVVTGKIWSFVPALFSYFRRPSAVVQLLVDQDRGVLYARSADSKIRLFDLGFGCTSPAVYVAELRSVQDAFESNPQAGRILQVDGEDQRKRRHRIIQLSIAPPYELDRPSIHAIATAADGTRLYLGTRFTDPQVGAVDWRVQRPNTLVLKSAQAPPQRPGAAFNTRSTGPLALVSQQQAQVDFVDVTAAVYCAADVLLSIKGPGSTQLIVNRCDAWSSYGTSASGLCAADPANPSDKEPRMIEGEALALCPLRSAAGRSPVLAALQQQAVRTSSARQPSPVAAAVFNQLFGAPARYLVITAQGTITVEKRQPVDVLLRLLTQLVDGERAAMDRVRDLMDALGPPEAAALFLTVGTKPGRATAHIVDQARTLFFDAGLWGDPLAGDDANPRPTTQPRTDVAATTATAARPATAFGALPAGASAAGGLGAARPLPAPGATAPAPAVSTATATLDMGRAVVESAEPTQTPQYRGVLIFMSRVLRPVWDEPVLRLTAGELRVAVAQDALLVIEDRLRAMAAFLRMATARRAAAVLGSAGGFGMPGDMAAAAPVNPNSTGSMLFGSSSGGGGGTGAAALALPYGPAPGAATGGQVTGGKRRRAEEMIKQEESALSRLQALVHRACEALVLLRLAATHGGVTALRPGALQNELSYLDGSKFLDLVASHEGELRLRRLAANILASARSEGGERGAALADAYCATLEDCCPTFFPREDRAEARAWSLLQRALENATDDVTKRKWAEDAVALLSRHPRPEVLPHAVQLLARAGHWEGTVTVAVRFADTVSGGPLAPDTPEVRGAREAAYRHVLDALRSVGEAPAPRPTAAAAASAPGTSGGGAAPPRPGRGLLSGFHIGGGGGGGSAASTSAPAAPPRPAEAGAGTALPPTPTAPSGPWAFTAALDAEGRTLARRKILRAAAASNDPHLLEALFRFLAQHVDAFPEVADPDLEMPGLEAWLRAVGFSWPDNGQGADRVAMAEVLRNLELLGRMYMRKARYVDAAEVYERLAFLPEAPAPPPAVAAVSVGLPTLRPETLRLDRRLAYLELAVLQARASGDGAHISRAEEALHLGSLQEKMLLRARELVGLAKDGGAQNATTTAVSPERLAAFHALEGALAQGGLLPATELYQVAQHLQMWDLDLEIMKICRYSGPGAEEVARVLWDNVLKKTLEEAWNARGTDPLAPLRGGAAGSVPGALPVTQPTGEAELVRGTTATQLRALACGQVEALGARLFPSETCMVLTHLALRLESLAGGAWPEELRRVARPAELGEDPQASEAIACALVALCHNHWELPLRAYDTLLFHTPPLGLQRVQLLTTLKHLVRIACLKPEDIRARELALSLANAGARDAQRSAAAGPERDALVASLQESANMLRYSLLG